jgi:ribosome maturation factor RimP
MTTPIEYKLSALIAPLLDAEGIDLVQLSLLGEGRSTVLQILAEDRATKTLDLDTCARLSRTIGTHLEVEDPMKDPYRLEISSPGLERPLTRPEHFTRYIGHAAKIETTLPLLHAGATTPGRRFQGVIASSNDDTFTLDTDMGPVVIEHANIARAKLKLPDDFFGATARPKPGHPKLNPHNNDKGSTAKGVAKK